MFVKVLAQVKKVEKESEYQGYDKPRLEYTQSTLIITENGSGITGHIVVRESLPIGEFFKVVIDTREPAATVVKDISNEIEEAMLNGASHG